MSIYDDINFSQDPYHILKISRKSDDITIKEAYKLIKKSTPPNLVNVVDQAYDLIKTRENRAKYSLISNIPYESMNDIKELGLFPRRLSTVQWLELVTDNIPET